MSDPFVNGLPMRWEFGTLLNNITAAALDMDIGQRDAYVAARADCARAFDLLTARIAELEAENKKMADRLVAGSEPIFASNAQLRARIAREFMEAVDAEWFGTGHGSMDDIREQVLARWEAAAQEGV